MLEQDVLYELVVLHPEYFLPKGMVFTTFSRAPCVQYQKDYVVAPDRILRESPGNDATFPRLPPFSFDHAYRSGRLWLNPFLVVMNAEIHFRRFRAAARADS